MRSPFRLLMVLLLLVVLPTCAKKHVPTEASSGQKSAGGEFDDAEGMEEGEDPEDKNKCRLASLRHCSDQCDGVWGMMCAWGQACNPVQHYCEKAEP